MNEGVCHKSGKNYRLVTEQEILRDLARLSGDFRKFQEEFELVGKHLTNTKMRYDESDKRLAKFGDKLRSLNGTEAGHIVEETKKLPL